jgi:RNA polymerase sigma factor (sigma-70 family)
VSLPPFQHLVDAHWRDVARLSHALVGPVAADDVAQQAWTQALAAYPRLTHGRNLRSWLLTVTHRCAMDHHRATRRTRPHEDPASLLPAATAPGPEAPDEDLWARVAALPARQRDAVVLRFVGDLDHRAVAAALGTTPGMSRRLVSDALAALRLDLPDREDLR